MELTKKMKDLWCVGGPPTPGRCSIETEADDHCLTEEVEFGDAWFIDRREAWLRRTCWGASPAIMGSDSDSDDKGDNFLAGFAFGNVDERGKAEVDYLDQVRQRLA